MTTQILYWLLLQRISLSSRSIFRFVSNFTNVIMIAASHCSACRNFKMFLVAHIILQYIHKEIPCVFKYSRVPLYIYAHTLYFISHPRFNARHSGIRLWFHLAKIRGLTMTDDRHAVPFVQFAAKNERFSVIAWNRKGSNASRTPGVSRIRLPSMSVVEK